MELQKKMAKKASEIQAMQAKEQNWEKWKNLSDEEVKKLYKGDKTKYFSAKKQAEIGFDTEYSEVELNKIYTEWSKTGEVIHSYKEYETKLESQVLKQYIKNIKFKDIELTLDKHYQKKYKKNAPLSEIRKMRKVWFDNDLKQKNTTRDDFFKKGIENKNANEAVISLRKMHREGFATKEETEKMIYILEAKYPKIKKDKILNILNMSVKDAKKRGWE